MASVKLFPTYSAVVLLALAAIAGSADSEFELTILHTNDVHARFEPFDRYGVSCGDEDAEKGHCYGGVARRKTKIDEIRASEENVLLLDAGDQFQGTLWFYHYRGAATSHFMNALRYDAMALGNHEFDLEIEGLLPFLANVSFPVLCANMDATKEPSIQATYFESFTFNVSGRTIGVVGYIYSRTDTISPTGELVFLPEVESIQKEVDLLQGSGVKHIIALGHSGIDIDLGIARKVRGLDVVVGGHSDTFLYNGDVPEGETSPVYGPYPIVVNPDYDPSLNVLVVQDSTLGKYLGYLKVTFDGDGDVIDWEGNPILLDSSVEEDPEILAQVQKMGVVVEDSFDEVVGSTHVLLKGDIYTCREKECNLGNLICDAMLWEHIKYQGEYSWSDVSIAFITSGSIRSTIPQGDIILGDVMRVLPFGNTNDIFELQGQYLLEILEHSVANYNPDIHPGEFMQYTGISVTYNLENDPGSRVVSARVMCTNCSVPEYEPLDPDKMYKMVTTSYIAGGGDGYYVIGENKQNYVTGDLDTSTMSDFVRSRSPIYIGLENRISFLDADNKTCSFGMRWSVSRNSIITLMSFNILLTYLNL